jgi:signal transduction histidine kinase/CHASE3 domain sensor protein
MAEQLFCKPLVGGSIPFAGSIGFNVQTAVFEGRGDAVATPVGLSVNSMSLKWRTALLFGGQLLLVGGGVIALLFIQQAQHAAVASTDSARRAQVLEAQYRNGMTGAEGALQEYLNTGDPSTLPVYFDGLAQVDATGDALRLVDADATERLRLDRMFVEAAAWRTYAVRALSPLQYGPQDQAAGDQLFESYGVAQQLSTDYLEAVVRKAYDAEAQASSAEITTLGAIGAVALASIVAGSVLVYRSTLRPMGGLIRAARELAAGGRTELPLSASPGEIGDLSRALHAWQRSSAKRSAIAEAMHEVSGRVERDQIVRMGLERLLEVSDGVEVAVILIGDSGITFTTMAADRTVIGPTVLAAGSPMEVVLASGFAQNGDLRNEGWPDLLRGWGKTRGCGPLLLLPMVSGSKLVGGVAATRLIDRPAFDAADVALVEAIASPLAAALRVAALFDEVLAVSAQLDVASRHKTDFLSSMSHELRTPLNSILGFAELLLTPGFDSVTARQGRYIENIRVSGVHLASLIDDGLDLAKVESGKVELKLERVDIGLLVEEVVTAMQPLADAAEIRLVKPGGRIGAISADKRKLHQVLLNLVSNAIKFTPAAGSVTIVVRRTDDALLLTVVDTGIGVAAEDQERIFGAFEQVSGANRDGGGTGLGLALARRLVELHGGRLWLESGIGRGSSFHISLPIQTATVNLPEGHLPQMATVLQK